MTRKTDGKRIIACVTGASGMIGRRIVHKLLARGYRVRVLTRSKIENEEVEVFRGGLADKVELEKFISGAEMVFHCAAELNDESKMHEANVLGTERIVKLIGRHQVKYFCNLSSAGVVGRTSQKWVDEASPCHPQDEYGKTKYKAEKVALVPISGCSTVILRPTTVVDETHLGELILPANGSTKSRMKVIFRGRECAHIVHAEDVAEAAIFFSDRKTVNPRVFFVSLDDDPSNTVADLWFLYRAISAGRYSEKRKNSFHLPLFFPHLHRRLMRRVGNRGDVRYTSKSLSLEGFRFNYGVAGAVERILQDRASQGLGRCGLAYTEIS